MYDGYHVISPDVYSFKLRRYNFERSGPFPSSTIVLPYVDMSYEFLVDQVTLTEETIDGLTLAPSLEYFNDYSGDLDVQVVDPYASVSEVVITVSTSDLTLGDYLV